MMRLLAALALIGLGLFATSGALERAVLYPFDPTRGEPPAGLAESTLTTPDGATLVVWSAPPAPGKPTILYFHGNAGNLALRDGRFSAFHKRGYGIVTAGYRGSSGSTGTPSESALISDARALAATLHGPVVYYGESLGAALAIALAKTDPPTALVLEAPFASLADMSAHLYGSPALARLLKSRWPSLERITRVSAPLLILHGAQDSLVPPAQGRALLNAAASPDKRLYLVEGAGHTNVWQPDAQRVLFAFLGRV